MARQTVRDAIFLASPGHQLSDGAARGPVAVDPLGHGGSRRAAGPGRTGCTAWHRRRRASAAARRRRRVRAGHLRQGRHGSRPAPDPAPGNPAGGATTHRPASSARPARTALFSADQNRRDPGATPISRASSSRSIPPPHLGSASIRPTCPARPPTRSLPTSFSLLLSLSPAGPTASLSCGLSGFSGTGGPGSRERATLCRRACGTGRSRNGRDGACPRAACRIPHRRARRLRRCRESHSRRTSPG